MAIPTISSVTPSRGHTGGGTLLRIVGTGFQLPAEPPASGSGPVPVGPATVRVLIGGVEARRVRVASATVLYVTTERRDPGSALPVVVRNVGPYGETIGAESATLASAYEYARPDFADATRPSELERLVRTLRAELIRQVHPEVVVTAHVDWTEDPAAILRGVTKAKEPAVFLAGPTLRPNNLYRTAARSLEPVLDAAGVAVPDVVREHRAALTDDVVFTIGALSSNYQTLLSLLAALRDFKLRNPRLSFARSLGSSELVEYDLDWEGDITADSSPSESGIRTCQGTIVISGFDTLSGQGFVSDQAVTAHPTLLEDPELESESREV
jgi:hypothetical protein